MGWPGSGPVKVATLACGSNSTSPALGNNLLVHSTLSSRTAMAFPWCWPRPSQAAGCWHRCKEDKTHPSKSIHPAVVAVLSTASIFVCCSCCVHEVLQTVRWSVCWTMAVARRNEYRGLTNKRDRPLSKRIMMSTEHNVRLFLPRTFRFPTPTRTTNIIMMHRRVCSPDTKPRERHAAWESTLSPRVPKAYR